MRFPFVKDLCFVHPNENLEPIVRYALIKATYAAFESGGIASDDIMHRLNECEFAGIYSPSNRDKRIAKLAVVPKKFNEGRAITTTLTAETGVAASLRETIFQHARAIGVESMVDIFDQSSSGKVLREHFDTISCVDLAGGSSCLTVKNLDFILFKTKYVLPFWRSSRPVAFSYNGKVHELNTLTMGDASSVGLLTLTLFLCQVLAYMRYHNLVVCMDNFRIAIKAMRRDGRFRTVGDDLIFPDYLRPLMDEILAGLGVSINTRKSSSALSAHKESCGRWFIEEHRRLDKIGLCLNKTWIREIYPFRAAVPEDLSPDSVKQVIEQFIEKVDKSPYAYCLFKAHCEVLLPPSERNKYEKQLSYHPSIVGTRFGTVWSHEYRSVRASQPCIIDDSLAYIRNLAESSVNPRRERIPVIARLRIRKKPVDLSAKSSRNHLFIQGSAIASVLQSACMYKHTVAVTHVFNLLMRKRPTPLPPLKVDSNTTYQNWLRCFAR